MKIKLDENLPARLVSFLEEFDHDVDTVVDEGLTGREDAVIWASVLREGRFFITQDLDFSDIRHFEPGTHPGLLLVRLREPGAKALLDRIESLTRRYTLDEWKYCFVVLTDHKIRVKKP